MSRRKPSPPAITITDVLDGPAPIVVTKKHLSMFRNADASMNVGYVTLFWIVFTIIVIVLSMLGAAFWEQATDSLHHFSYLTFGQGVALVVAALLPMLAGVAAFLWSDSKNPQLGTTTTTSVAQQQTKVTP